MRAQQDMELSFTRRRGNGCRIQKRHVAVNASCVDLSSQFLEPAAGLHLVAGLAPRRKRIGLLLHPVHVMAGRTGHRARTKAFALLQRADLVAMHINLRGV